MKIAIVGAGNVGQALGEGWTPAHEVSYVRRATPPEEAAALLAGADVVAITTPANQAEAAVSGRPLAGKVVIDCTNPLKSDLSGLELGFDTSQAERVAKAAPGARLVKAFNTVGFNVMTNPRFAGRNAMMAL
ncbi:MAG: dinucleotide-binding enzyme, partial [Candidatus Eremiobacteraeota bacterium]|nr:dinucleotide-binding enzyme [Candidatus Eremiobacteraeota bacterium]